MQLFSRLLPCLAVLSLLATLPTKLQAANPIRLMVDLSEKPDSVLLGAFDLCIVDAEARVDLEAQQSLGNKMLARVNVFEIKETSAAALAAVSVGIPLLEGPKKGWVRLDATHPNWVALVLRNIVQSAAMRGFDGFVLAGLDTISQDAERAACLRAINALDVSYPDKQIVIESGLDMVPEARRALDGVLLLGQEAGPVLDQKIRSIKRLGVSPLVVTYAGPENQPEELATLADHLRGLGAVPFFTTPSLTGVHLGPLQEVTRKILVIHSGGAGETFTSKVLHGSLAWLGQQVCYLDVGGTVLPAWEDSLSHVSGIILDASLRPVPQQQKALLSLVDYLKKHQVPLLLTGPLWGNPEEFSHWSSRLGFKGNGQPREASTASFRHIEQAWLQEDGVARPRTEGFLSLQAPQGARVHSSIQAGNIVFDQVFLTSWGGVWMDAVATLAGPQLQPLPFLESWLSSQPTAPILDVATQNGRQLMIPVVDSEGFTQPTSLQGLPIAAETLTQRILTRHALPFTVALCEGDVRAVNPGLDPRDALRYEAAARALLALPQVQAASSGRSRPLDWSTTGEMEREVAGSLAYIHRQLLPPGRSVQMMLWPQENPPTDKTVAFSRLMGVENLGIKAHSPLPGRSSTAPMAPAWGQGNALQPLAATPRSQGNLDANAFIARATAQRSGRWVSPLHVTLNFADAATENSLWEVERVLGWCENQPLHAMSAADHARLVRDAAHTRIFQQGSGHWILVNSGHARTLRLPVTAGLPDMERSVGLAGYIVRGNELYVHTLGRRRTELVLTPRGSPGHLRLASTSGSVRYLEAGQQRALLQVAALRPVELAFEGIPSGAVCMIQTTEAPQFIQADAHGRVEVTVPALTTVRLQVMPAQQSAMR